MEDNSYFDTNAPLFSVLGCIFDHGGADLQKGDSISDYQFVMIPYFFLRFVLNRERVQSSNPNMSPSQ